MHAFADDPALDLKAVLLLLLHCLSSSLLSAIGNDDDHVEHEVKGISGILSDVSDALGDLQNHRSP